MLTAKFWLRVNTLIASIIISLLSCNDISVLYCTVYVSKSCAIYGVTHEISAECGAVITLVATSSRGGIFATKYNHMQSMHIMHINWGKPERALL